jgi:hypothetical protein
VVGWAVLASPYVVFGSRLGAVGLAAVCAGVYVYRKVSTFTTMPVSLYTGCNGLNGTGLGTPASNLGCVGGGGVICCGRTGLHDVSAKSSQSKSWTIVVECHLN